MPTTELEELTPPARRIASVGLKGEPGGQIEVPGERWGRFLAYLAHQRLSGLAVEALEAGRLSLSPEQEQDLIARHRQVMMGALTVERELVQIAAAFEEAGIEALVLKGPAVAHSAYPDPSWRPFGDLDLLVRTGHWRLACGVLEDLGRRRRLPEVRPGFDEQFGKAAVYRADEGIEIDLHRTLVLGPFGLWMKPNELFERTTAFWVGGKRLRRLDDTHLLLHACMHAVLGLHPPLLWPLRDVAEIAACRIDWDELARRADAWRLRAVIRRAFEVTTATLGVRLPVECEGLVAIEPSRQERRALAAYTTDRRGRGGTELSTLRAIPGVGAKVVYVRGLLFPRREFLAARAGTAHPSYLRRWGTPIHWLFGRRETRTMKRPTGR